MNLEFNDLLKILAIFDIAASRGAFKGNELAEVGAVFNRVQMAAQEMEKINAVFQTPLDEELKPE